MTPPKKYAGLRGNKNRAGKTKPADQARTQTFAVKVTHKEKGILKAAAYPQKMSDIYLPVLLKEAHRLLRLKPNSAEPEPSKNLTVE